MPNGCGVHERLAADVGPRAEWAIPSNDHLFDALAEANIQPSNCHLVFKKRLWLPREDWSSDAYTSLVFHQVMPAVGAKAVRALRGLLGRAAPRR